MSDIKKKNFTYYSPKDFNIILDNLMQDVNVKSKKRFFEMLINGETFNKVESGFEGNNNQLKSFVSNKNQLEKIDRYFFNHIKKEMKDTTVKVQVCDFDNVATMVKKLHCIESENVIITKWKEKTETEEGDKGLTPFSPDFVECYIKVLTHALYKFDTEIAEFKPVLLDCNSDYFNNLMVKLRAVSGEEARKDYRRNGMKKTLLKLDCLDDFYKGFNDYVSSEKAKIQGDLNAVSEVIIDTTERLTKLSKQNDIATFAVNDITMLLNEITVRNGLKVRNFDFITHLISNIKIIEFKPEPKNEEIIKEVKSLMTLLNDEIHDYNIMKKNKKSSQNEILKKILKVKLTLRMVSMKIYNLVK